jgi:hypothetical protein
MTSFIGWLIEKLTGWLAFWNEDRDMGHAQDEDYMNEAYEERPDMELYDDCYPWSRR